MPRMRITLLLHEDLLSRVKTYAVSRRINPSKAITELVGRGLHAPLQTRVINGFHVVDLPAGSPAITREQIRRLEAE